MIKFNSLRGHHGCRLQPADEPLHRLALGLGRDLMRGVFLDDKKTTQGALKVSFFGPFYASYNVIDLDKAGYRWAMVCGRDKSYFWILSKDSVMEQGQLHALVAKAATLGFDTAKLRYLGKKRP